MLEGLKQPDPPLSDGIVTLRPPDPTRDAASLPAFTSDSEIVRWLAGERQPLPDPAEAFGRQLKAWEAGTDAYFSIDATGRATRAGLTRVLFGLVDPYRTAEIGYALLADARGRGYATRTVRLLAGWIFGELGLERIQARTELGNVASERVLERAGFTREGVARLGGRLASGRRADVVMWSLLPGELR